MTCDSDHMRAALALARRGLGQTWPNPSVGCVIVRDGTVVGEGWHRRAGEPHAEALALAQAGERSRGATVYVTLEPCSHFGRTPPCADALVAAGAARVIAAMEDPNPLVAGRGLQRCGARDVVDRRLDLALAFLGGVVLGVLGQVAVRAGFLDRLDDRGTLDGLEVAHFVDQLAVAFGQHGSLVDGGHE